MRLVREDLQRTLDDPGDDPRLQASAEHRRGALAAYEAAGEGVFGDLAAAGYPIKNLDDLLPASTEGYRDVIVPILLRWLPRVEYESLRCHILQWLKSPHAGPSAVPGLLAELRRIHPSARVDANMLLMGVTEALEATAGRRFFTELSEIASDPSQGVRRLAPTWALGKMSTPDALDVLVQMLGTVDSDWIWNVLYAMWKVKPAVLRRARSAVEPFLAHPYFANRREAAKIMRKIARYEERKVQPAQGAEG
jgi:hypothetical protein